MRIGRRNVTSCTPSGASGGRPFRFSGSGTSGSSTRQALTPPPGAILGADTQLNPPRWLYTVCMAAKDLTGMRFGSLLVIARAPSDPITSRAFWTCQCDCGQRVDKNGKYLLCGDTRSCGCSQRAMRQRGNPKHGAVIAFRAHKREYSIWRSMKSRCFTASSSNYRFYGAKGVTVCDRWLDFLAFVADMGPCPANHTLDRIDPFGNYEPSNCRWASWETQHQNLRKSRSRASAA